jgi:RNA polymerase sigma-70 factor (ECF subfamily)
MISDEKLMISIGQGDTAAFDELVERYGEIIYNFLYRLQGTGRGIEDVVQEVFIKIYRYAPNYKVEAKAKTYIFTIAKNCWLDMLRKNSKRKNEFSLFSESSEGMQVCQRLESGGSTPLQQAVVKEGEEEIQEAINRLPDKFRLVFVMSEINDMKYAEIAEAMDIPIGTVKSRMHKAISLLREALSGGER